VLKIKERSSIYLQFSVSPTVHKQFFEDVFLGTVKHNQKHVTVWALQLDELIVLENICCECTFSTWSVIQTHRHSVCVDWKNQCKLDDNWEIVSIWDLYFAHFFNIFNNFVYADCKRKKGLSESRSYFQYLL